MLQFLLAYLGLFWCVCFLVSLWVCACLRPNASSRTYTYPSCVHTPITRAAHCLVFRAGRQCKICPQAKFLMFKNKPCIVLACRTVLHSSHAFHMYNVYCATVFSFLRLTFIYFLMLIFRHLTFININLWFNW